MQKPTALAYRVLALAIAFSLLTSGCDRKPVKPQENLAPIMSPYTERQQLWPTYHSASLQLFNKSRDCITQLRAALLELLAKNDEEQLTHSLNLLDQCIRYQLVLHGLQLSNNQSQAELITLQQRILSRVEYPGFIDAVQEHPYSGIVQDASLPLNRDSLAEQHGLTDESEISLGLDVLGFLLQGEHRYQPDLDARSIDELSPLEPQQLSATQTLDQHPQQRRRQYLALASTIVLDDARKQAAIWLRESNRAPSANIWRAWALALAQRQLLLMDHPLLTSDVVAQWWALWHLSPEATRSENEEAISLANILVTDQYDADLRHEITALIAEPERKEINLISKFQLWLTTFVLPSASLNLEPEREHPALAE